MIDNYREIIPEGTVLYNVSPFDNSESILDHGFCIYTYREGEEHDRMIYTNCYAMELAIEYGRSPYEHSFITTKNLKLASEKDTYKMLKILYRVKKNFICDEFEHLQEVVNETTMINNPINVDIRNLKTDEDWKDAHKLLFEAVAKYNYLSSKIFLGLLGMRFDGVLDYHDIGRYYEAKKPTIIFKPEKSLMVWDDPRKIDIEKAHNYINNMRKDK